MYNFDIVFLTKIKLYKVKNLRKEVLLNNIWKSYIKKIKSIPDNKKRLKYMNSKVYL
jgi:hypothetical protein